MGYSEDRISDDARELELYAENDGALYSARLRPAYRALAERIAKGTYQTAKAVAMFVPIMNEAERRYAREIEPRKFSAADKRAVARRFVEYFETEIKLGNVP
jgi:hypothetical protein